MAPIMPHITDEIYNLYFKGKEKAESIHVSEWPKQIKITADEKAGDAAVSIISEIRKFKAQKNMSLKKELKNLVIEYDDESALKPFLEDIKATVHAQNISFGKGYTEISEGLKIHTEE